MSKLVVFSTYRDTPGQRFRVHQWIPTLRELGITVEESVFATPRLEVLSKIYGRQAEKSAEMLKSFVRLAVRRPHLADFDGAFIYREIAPVGPPLAELSLARRGLPVAMDVDDPIFLQAMAYNSRSPFSRYFKDPGRVARILSELDRVAVINDAIGDWAKQYARRVDVLPNIVRMERYPQRPAGRAPGALRVGYSGSPSTTFQLEAIRDALDDVDQEIPLELRVMGGRAPFALQRGQTTELAWSAETEAENLASFDIGLAPAPDEELYRYKSPVKVLLYMAVGIPVVTSPFGQAGKVVEHGVTGFHARTRGDWRDAIMTLAHDPDLCTRMGTAGRERVAREFSREAVLPKVGEFFQGLLRRPPESSG